MHNEAAIGKSLENVNNDEAAGYYLPQKKSSFLRFVL